MRTSVALCIVMLFASAAWAADSHQIGFWIATDKVGDTRSPGDVESEVAFDNGEGFALSANCFYGNFAAELAATPLKHDGDVSIGGTQVFGLGSLDIIPITATLQYHFARDARFSPYVGAGAAYVLADDLESDDLDAVGIGKVKVDKDFTWVAQAGVNVNLSRRWALAFDAKYIAYTPDSAPQDDDEPLELDLNPVIFSAGVKIRF